MEKRYQVFVSSTFADLTEERQHLIQAILELDCIPVGMEMFPAANDDQWTLIKKVIDGCDYYVVVVAGRYGTTHPQTGISFTEMEYDYAVEQGKPVLGFIHANPGSISSDNSERTEEGRNKLEAFRQKVQSKMVRFWENPHELGGKVSRSLSKSIKQSPAEGWVRSRFVISPEEIVKRDRRIEELEAELLAVSALIPAPDPELSESAGRLLREAVRDKNGRIMSMGTMQGWTVSTNGIELLREGTGLAEAEWRGAVEELVTNEFIEACGNKGEVFRVTKKGYEFVEKHKNNGHDELDAIIESLTDPARCYLMTLSRPRNQDGIPVSSLDYSGSRESAHYQELLRVLSEHGLLKEGPSIYTITQKGYEISDRLWDLYILRAISAQQQGQYDYVDTEKIAEQVVLIDGESEALELQRHSSSLMQKGCVETVPIDAGIGAARITANARAFLRNYTDVELASVE